MMHQAKIRSTAARRVFVTGGNGFIGSHLVKELHEAGYKVTAPVFELRDQASVRSALGRDPWDIVIHLAAMSDVRSCEQDPEAARQVNVAGTRNLVECLKETSSDPLLLFASSAQVYAAPTSEEIHGRVVMDEERAAQPQNRYAATKLEAEQVVRAASAGGQLHSVILRLFNHSHRTQSDQFFLPYVYQQILRHRRESESPELVVPAGNVEVQRDIGSVFDLSRAFLELLSAPLPFGPERSLLLNVCSGTAKRLRTVGEFLGREFGLKVSFQVDPSRIRPNDPEAIIGSNARLRALTRWTSSAVSEMDLVREFLR
jgi:GDP-4-dehydro-6-deoxy-D-mannose reductase